VPFRKEVFMEDVRRLNAKAPLFELSVTKGDGFDSWLSWLQQGRAAKA
jgi:Ni2+-binding GTPase involved in maturation of urease and hydrogenase